MPFEFKPRRTVAECNAIMTAPGMIHELEHVLIDGRVQRVYKHLPPSLRLFWRAASAQHHSKTYIVFEEERLTYGQVHQQASNAANLFREVYGVRKGDRVAIAMRNFPEWLIAFWAIHLIGAVAVCVNAWLPAEPFKFCLENTECKVIVVDAERADRLESLLPSIRPAPHGVLVVRGHEGKGTWNGITGWEEALRQYRGPQDAWSSVEECGPDDNATIFFTSGTTGLPKGVLSTHRAFLTNVLNASSGARRAALRRGEDIPIPDPNEPQKAVLISVPLFHVTGCTSMTMSATALGSRIVFIRKWIPDQAANLIRDEGITNAGGVPSMVLDLIESDLVGSPKIESLSSGGAAAPRQMAEEARRAFPNAVLGQGYGLTETNAIAAGFTGEDYEARPTSTGLAALVNDLLIMDPETGRSMPPGEVGELWIRGPNVMKEYWRNPEATAAAITRDGWFKSGDLASIDEDGFLYIRDRAKDIIIRGGENIHSITVENALYTDHRLLDCAAVGVPDRRLGELVTAVVYPKPGWKGRVREEEVIAAVKKQLPSFAVPVMVLILGNPIERNAAGKVLKDKLRKIVQGEWSRRKGQRMEQAKL